MRRLRISTQPISMIRSPSLALRPVVSVSSTICLLNRRIPRGRYSFIGEPVGPFVLGMASVALHPMPLYLMERRQCIQLFPQIDIFNRLLVRGEPAASLPVVHPLGDSLHHVQGIGVDLDAAGPLERLERPDYRRDLHAVVRRVGFAAVELFLDALRPQERAPTARAGISPARAVAVD